MSRLEATAGSSVECQARDMEAFSHARIRFAREGLGDFGFMRIRRVANSFIDEVTGIGKVELDVWRESEAGVNVEVFKDVVTGAIEHRNLLESNGRDAREAQAGFDSYLSGALSAIKLVQKAPR